MKDSTWKDLARMLSAYMLLFACIIVLLAFASKEQLIMSVVFILLHECGHLLAARVAGYKPDKGLLHVLPFGISIGFTKRFMTPYHDIAVSMAGPMVNLMLFLIFYIASIQNETGGLMNTAAKVNLVLGAFNLMPAGFLDGGRIVRAAVAYGISYYYSCIVANICGMVLGLFISGMSLYRGISPTGISLLMLGIFFMVNSVLFLQRNTYLTLNYILNKNYDLDLNKNFKIRLVCYSPKTKLLDIIKNFCFNKYYVVYIMENNNLRYNINEADLICLFCKYGNISLEDCVYYTKEQEGENG